jgi:hypothetical protein
MKSEMFKKSKRFGIFGPSESGKTTLAKKISAFMFGSERRKTMVLDPVQKGNWGPHAKMYVNEQQFWQDIYHAKNCLVVVDDASVTINRDNELNGVFTTLRHCGHKLVVIGHHPQNLLPQMREQLQRVFIFSQTPKSLELWQLNFPQADLSQAESLQQYEFITVANHEPVEKFKLTI